MTFSMEMLKLLRYEISVNGIKQILKKILLYKVKLRLLEINGKEIKDQEKITEKLSVLRKRIF